MSQELIVQGLQDQNEKQMNRIEKVEIDLENPNFQNHENQDHEKDLLQSHEKREAQNILLIPNTKQSQNQQGLQVNLKQ